MSGTGSIFRAIALTLVSGRSSFVVMGKLNAYTWQITARQTLLLDEELIDATRTLMVGDCGTTDSLKALLVAKGVDNMSENEQCQTNDKSRR